MEHERSDARLVRRGADSQLYPLGTVVLVSDFPSCCEYRWHKLQDLRLPTLGHRTLPIHNRDGIASIRSLSRLKLGASLPLFAGQLLSQPCMKCIGKVILDLVSVPACDLNVDAAVKTRTNDYGMRCPSVVDACVVHVVIVDEKYKLVGFASGKVKTCAAIDPTSRWPSAPDFIDDPLLMLICPLCILCLPAVLQGHQA